jgi:hypothetical protein
VMRSHSPVPEAGDRVRVSQAHAPQAPEIGRLKCFSGQ